MARICFNCDETIGAFWKIGARRRVKPDVRGTNLRLAQFLQRNFLNLFGVFVIIGYKNNESLIG